MDLKINCCKMGCLQLVVRFDDFECLIPFEECILTLDSVQTRVFAYGVQVVSGSITPFTALAHETCGIVSGPYLGWAHIRQHDPTSQRYIIGSSYWSQLGGPSQGTHNDDSNRDTNKARLRIMLDYY